MVDNCVWRHEIIGLPNISHSLYPYRPIIFCSCTMRFWKLIAKSALHFQVMPNCCTFCRKVTRVSDMSPYNCTIKSQYTILANNGKQRKYRKTIIFFATTPQIVLCSGSTNTTIKSLKTGLSPNNNSSVRNANSITSTLCECVCVCLKTGRRLQCCEFRLSHKTYYTRYPYTAKKLTANKWHERHLRQGILTNIVISSLNSWLLLSQL